MIPTPERPWLVADIGGTNARLGLIEFRRRFEAKPPMEDYLRGIPTALIVASTPALAGAAARLASLELV